MQTSDEATRFVEAAFADEGGGERLGHSLGVGDRLAQIRAGETVVAAGYLHDVVEHADVPIASVQTEFGEPVARLVTAMTEDPTIAEYRERKQALRGAIQASGRGGLMVLAADKADQLTRIVTSGQMPSPWQLEHYRRSYELLVAGGVRTPHVEEFGRLLSLFSRPRLVRYPRYLNLG